MPLDAIHQVLTEVLTKLIYVPPGCSSSINNKKKKKKRRRRRRHRGTIIQVSIEPDTEEDTDKDLYHKYNGVKTPAGQEMVLA